MKRLWRDSEKARRSDHMKYVGNQYQVAVSQLPLFLCIKVNCCNRYAHIPITSPAIHAPAAIPVFPDLSSHLSSTAASPRRSAPRLPPVSVPVSLPIIPFLSSVLRFLPFCRLPSSAVFLFPFVQALSRLPSPVYFRFIGFPFLFVQAFFRLPFSVCFLFLPYFPFGYLLIYLPPPQPSGHPDTFRHGLSARIDFDRPNRIEVGSMPPWSGGGIERKRKGLEEREKRGRKGRCGAGR